MHLAETEEMPCAPQPSLWRNRDYMLLWSGQLVSILGTGVSQIALPLLVLALTRSPAQAGLIAATQTVPYIVFSLPAGALIDRWDRKAVMICCDATRALAFGSIPLAHVFGYLTIVQLYVVALVVGTAYVFFNIAEVAALPQVVSAEQVAQATSLNTSADSAARMVGPGLGGVLIGLARSTVAGAAVAYAVDSLSYVVSVISLAFIRTPFQGARASEARGSLRAEIAEGMRFLWHNPYLRISAFLSLSSAVFLGAIPLAVIVLARTLLHADTPVIGFIFSGAWAGGLIGSLVMPWIRTRMQVGRIIIGTIAVWTLVAVFLATAGAPIVLLIGEAILAAVTSIFNITQVSHRLALIPDVLQGRVNSAFRLLALGGIPLGTAGGGILLAPLGPRAELWLVAVGLGLTALVVSFSEVRRI